VADEPVLRVVEADTSPPSPDAGPAFYFDLGSPESYLVAERILTTMPVPCEWIPIRAGDLPDGGAPVDRAAIEARAAALDLQAIRWPEPFPFDSDLAERAATYAKQIGRVVAFALAAFRQAYAGGRDLSVPDHVVIAGAACEMHPNAILKTVQTRGVTRALEEATALARERGVRSVPAVWTGSVVLHGEAALDRAAATLAAGAGAP
jgi:2-hydroxychromene-2-carboxylate isomerase